MALPPQQGASHRGPIQVSGGEQGHIGADQRSIIHTYHVDNVPELWEWGDCSSPGTDNKVTRRVNTAKAGQIMAQLSSQEERMSYGCYNNEENK